MAFHKSNLGSFGERLPCDVDGYVGERGDDFDIFNFEASIYSDDPDDMEWRRNEWFPEWIEECVSATKTACKAAEEWRQDN